MNNIINMHKNTLFALIMAIFCNHTMFGSFQQQQSKTFTIIWKQSTDDKNSYDLSIGDITLTNAKEIKYCDSMMKKQEELQEEFPEETAEEYKNKNVILFSSGVIFSEKIKKNDLIDYFKLFFKVSLVQGMEPILNPATFTQFSIFKLLCNGYENEESFLNALSIVDFFLSIKVNFDDLPSLTEFIAKYMVISAQKYTQRNNTQATYSNFINKVIDPVNILYAKHGLRFTQSLLTAVINSIINQAQASSDLINTADHAALINYRNTLSDETDLRKFFDNEYVKKFLDKSTDKKNLMVEEEKLKNMSIKQLKMYFLLILRLLRDKLDFSYFFQFINEQIRKYIPARG